MMMTSCPTHGLLGDAGWPSFFDTIFFFFNDTATTEIYTLSLHDALPISRWSPSGPTRCSAIRTRASWRGSAARDRKSTRLNSSHSQISYAVFCLKKKNKHHRNHSGRHDAAHPEAERHRHEEPRRAPARVL